MIVSNYEHGYYDEDGRTHVVQKNEKGWTTYCYDILIKIKSAKSASIEHPEHPYIGLSYFGKDNKKMTVERVIQHFGFGDYWTVLAADENRSHAVWTLSKPGTAIEKTFTSKDALNWEKQLEDQVKGE